MHWRRAGDRGGGGEFGGVEFFGFAAPARVGAAFFLSVVSSAFYFDFLIEILDHL